MSRYTSTYVSVHVRQLLATTTSREIFGEDKQRTVIDVVPVDVVMQCVVDLQNDVETKGSIKSAGRSTLRLLSAVNLKRWAEPFILSSSAHQCRG
jgi:hypothetical protein